MILNFLERVEKEEHPLFRVFARHCSALTTFARLCREKYFFDVHAAEKMI